MRSTPWPKLILRTVKLACARVVRADDDAFERLKAFFVAFLDLDLDFDGVAGPKFWEIGAAALGQQLFDD